MKVFAKNSKVFLFNIFTRFASNVCMNLKLSKNLISNLTFTLLFFALWFEWINVYMFWKWYILFICTRNTICSSFSLLRIFFFSIIRWESYLLRLCIITGCILSDLNFRLQLFCAAPLYLPEKWQSSLTFSSSLNGPPHNILFPHWKNTLPLLL